jgi:eukaryotic-like serine/threonine-protein kinase
MSQPRGGDHDHRVMQMLVGVRPGVGCNSRGLGSGWATMPAVAEDSPFTLNIGERVAGRYAIDRLLASGSMGAVYAATDAELGRRVAIKVAHGPAEYQRELERRLKTEARAAGRLEGAHVARVFEFGYLPSNSPYLVLEQLRGRTLEDERVELGRMPVRDAVGWILQACLGLAEAHGLGIAHRDIKPQNMFLAERLDGERHLKVIDFGAAAFVAKSWQVGSLDQAAIGTLHYMAPEQLRQPPRIDTRSDIWGLGATLYELIGGEPPFAGSTKREMLKRILDDEPRSLLQLCEGLNPFLDGVILRSLEKPLRKRFPDVAAFAAALCPYGPPGSHHLATRAAKVLANVAAEATPISVQPRPARGRLESRPLLLEPNSTAPPSEDPPSVPRAPRPRGKLLSVPFDLGTTRDDA